MTLTDRTFKKLALLGALTLAGAVQAATVTVSCGSVGQDFEN